MPRKKNNLDERDQCEICGDWFPINALKTHFWADMNTGVKPRRVAPNVHLCKHCLETSLYFREIEYYKVRGK